MFEDKIKLPILSNKIVIITIIIVGFIVYFNSLFNGFVADDFPQIVQNPLVQNINNIPSQIFQSTVYNPNNIAGAIYYKPALSVVFTLLYAFSIDGNPFGFHLLQVSLHIVNSILVFYLLSKFFNNWVSFLFSLTFLVHPINNEAVVYISNLQDVLFLFFGLSALLITIHKSKLKYSNFFVSILLLLSILSKETGILFLFIVPLYQYLFNRKLFLYNLKISFSVLGVYIFMRFFVAQIYFHTNSIVPIMNLSLFERILHIPKMIIYYLFTFVFPLNLSIFHTWTINELGMSNFYLPLIIIIFILLFIFAFGVVVYKNAKDILKIYIFFLSWLLIGLAIHLQIFPLDQTVSDRWFYFPHIGLLGLIATLLMYFKIDTKLKYVIPIFLIILILLSIRTAIRNFDWRDQFTLYTHDIKINKNSSQLELGLAIEYAKKNNSIKAEKHYLRSIEIFPNANNYYGTGIFYLKFKMYNKAKNNFMNAIKLEPTNSYYWMYLAISQYQMGDKENAKTNAEKAYSLFPNQEIQKVLKLIENNQEIILN